MARTRRRTSYAEAAGGSARPRAVASGGYRRLKARQERSRAQRTRAGWRSEDVVAMTDGRQATFEKGVYMRATGRS
jgi:hypothetical protein